MGSYDIIFFEYVLLPLEQTLLQNLLPILRKEMRDIQLKVHQPYEVGKVRMGC